MEFLKKISWGQTHFILLKFNGYPYANNDRSYELTNESINLDYLEKYLEQFCLKLKIEKKLLKKYGYGYLESYRIIVEPNYVE